MDKSPAKLKSFAITDQEWERRLSDAEKITYFAQIRSQEKTTLKRYVGQAIFFHPASDHVKKAVSRLFDDLGQYFVSKYAPAGFMQVLSKVLVLVHSSASWSQENKTPWPKGQKVPAARFLIKDGQPRAEIVLTADFALQAELNVNIARLFISDVLGKLFFDWRVLNRFPFQRIKYKKRPLDFSIVEKAQFFRFYDDYDSDTKEFFLKIGASYASNHERKIIAARQLFYNELIYQQKSNQEYCQKVEGWFAAFQKDFHVRQTKIEDRAFKKVYRSAFKIKLFNPDDRIVLVKLFTQKKPEFLYLVGELAKSLSANWLSAIAVMLDEQILLELAKDLKAPISYLTLESRAVDTAGLAAKDSAAGEHQRIARSDFTLRTIQRSLVAKNLAWQFLLPDELRTNADDKEHLNFKLWLHQNFYQALHGKTGQSAGIINQYLLREYRSSAFQRLYDFCGYLRAVLQSKNQSAIYLPRIKNILGWYIANKIFLEDIANFTTLFLDFKRSNNFDSAVLNRLQEFRKGWSGFFGNALLIDQANSQADISQIIKENQITRFKTLVYRTSLEELYSFSTALTALFLHVFWRLNEDLNVLLSFLSPGHPVVDNWIFNGFPAKLKSKQGVLQISQELSDILR